MPTQRFIDYSSLRSRSFPRNMRPSTCAQRCRPCGSPRSPGSATSTPIMHATLCARSSDCVPRMGSHLSQWGPLSLCRVSERLHAWRPPPRSPASPTTSGAWAALLDVPYSILHSGTNRLPRRNAQSPPPPRRQCSPGGDAKAAQEGAGVAAQAVLDVADASGGQGNFRFAVACNVPPCTPFFPVSYW